MRRLNARSLVAQPIMDSIRLQLRSNAPRSAHSRFDSVTTWKSSGKNLFLFFFFFFILVVVITVFVVSKSCAKFSALERRFGIFIDGGSTGTRIHVFEFSVDERGKRRFDFGKGGLASTRVSPGLSSFAGDPAGAGRSLLELLEFAKGRVPEGDWGGTEIRLMATAGMRLLDSDVRELILESCRRALRSSGFEFRDDWASVITGVDEGIYAWVAANYAHGTLGQYPQDTVGIIELGGASAQVTFVSSEPLPPEFAHSLKFGKFTYNLYSHSFLHLGQNVAYDSLRELLVSKDQTFAESVLRETYMDPCTPKGYSRGMGSWNLSPGALEKNKYLPSLEALGNFSECKSAALMLLQKGKDECSYKSCHIGNTFIPKLHGKVIATENFFYTSKFFGLPPKAFLSDMVSAGEKFCGEHWSKLQKKYPSLDEEDLLRYCFSSAYIVALLHDSLGIALNDDRIGFVNQLGGIPLDWALGAFILHNMPNLEVERPHWISILLIGDSNALFSLFVISLVVIFMALSTTKFWKSQLKTIYDLEKGRYIVT